MRKYIVIISVLLLFTLFLLPCSADSMTLKQLLDPGGGDLAVTVTDSTGLHQTAGYSWQSGNNDLVIGGVGDDNLDFIAPVLSLSYTNQMGLDYSLNPGDIVRLYGAVAIQLDGTSFLATPGDITGEDCFRVGFAFMVNDLITWVDADVTANYDYASGNYYTFTSTLAIPNGATCFCGLRLSFAFPGIFNIRNTDYIRAKGKDINLYVGSVQYAPFYDPADTTDLDNLDREEQEVFDQTEDGRQEYSTIVNAVRNIFNVTYISSGLLAVSAVLGRLFTVPFIGNLLYISLALGLFAFVLGLAHNVISRMRGGGR